MERAIHYYELALTIARDIGDRFSEGNQLSNLGLAYATLGNARRGEAFRSWNLGLLHEDTNPARAFQLMQVCVDHEREIGHPDAHADAEQVRALLAKSIKCHKDT